jgi:hypothetical protein
MWCKEYEAVIMKDMIRWRQWLALLWGIGLAAAGAVLAVALVGGRWALAGAAVGGVTGAFTPSLYEALRSGDARRKKLADTAESSLLVGLKSRARLLDARRQIVGFTGRSSELAELMAWCEAIDGDRLRLITGPGGVGKTRLAVELMRLMAKPRWMLERVADGQESIAISALRDVSRRRRALFVVDYAETRVGLEQMLAELAGDKGVGIRVLLLARSQGGWWDRLGVKLPLVWIW